MKKTEISRQIQVVHQIVSLTGINFTTKSIIGFVELTVIPLKENLKYIRLNAKQCAIYKVLLNGKHEASFQYFDPTLDIVQGVSHQHDVETYSDVHVKVCNMVDPDMNGGELNIKVPPDVQSNIAVGKPLTVSVEFSLENPQGGIHFVVPEGASNTVKKDADQSQGTGSSTNNSQSLADRAAHLFTCGHENASRLWFPCVDAMSELCTWKLEFTVDESMIAVSNGDLVETVYTPDLKRKTYHYVLSIPTAAPNIALAVGPFVVYVDPNMHEVTHFCLPHLLPVLKATARWVHEAFEFFEIILATRYPYSCYKQVFIDEAFVDVASYSTIAIMSTTLLASSAVIDQTYETRRMATLAVAKQFFGSFIVAERWSDRWLLEGLSAYLTGLFIKKTFGNNEYRNYIWETNNEVCTYERQYGGIILDCSQPPAPPVVRGEEKQHREQPKEVNAFAFDPSNLNSCSPEYLDVMTKKAHLAIRMLENRIGGQLLQVLNSVLQSAQQGCQQKKNPKAWKSLITSTLSFTKTIFLVTGKDMGVFMDQWVRTGGHARFRMEFVFNRKRNTVEMVIHQQEAENNTRVHNQSNLPNKGIKKYVGPVSVALQELDGWFNYNLPVEQFKSKHDITCHSKSRRNKKKKIPLVNNVEVDMDLSAMEDSPVLWIRVDPDMQLIRTVDIAQPDFQWQYQLRHERDVTAQREAALALEKFPTKSSRKALTDIIENEECFYKVRCIATHQLTKVANLMAASWDGPPAMLVIFKKMFGSFAASHIIKQNDFSNLQSYFLQKEIPVAMAGLRNSHGICPPEVLKFLLDLFKYNDNSKNTFSDNYYRAALVDALGETVTPVVSVLQAATSGTSNSNLITAESLSPDTKLILEEISRYLNLEKLLPSYKYTITKSCLKAIRKLQKTGHLPSNPGLFRDYAAHGQFVDVRIAALECLVDFVNVEGSWSDLNHLLDIIENDPVPRIRHILIRLLVDTPPFEKAKHHNNDKQDLIERLWALMNGAFWYDSRLRCDIVDLYAKLYGRKRPVSMPLAEFTSMKQKPYMIDSNKKADAAKSDSYRIPKKSEKPKDSMMHDQQFKYNAPPKTSFKKQTTLGSIDSGGTSIMRDSPFRVPAELSNTIEPKAEVLLAQQARQRQLSEKRDAPVGEVPDFLSGSQELDIPSTKMAPTHQGLMKANDTPSNPVSMGSRPNIPLPVEALGHFEPPSSIHESSRGLSVPVSHNLIPGNTRKVTPDSSGSSSSHHKHSKEKKKKKDKKKHKHKDKEKKKSKKHDKEKKRKLTPSTSSENKHSSISVTHGEDVGASEASAQGMSSGSSSCGSPSDSPKRIKTDEF